MAPVILTVICGGMTVADVIVSARQGPPELR